MTGLGPLDPQHQPNLTPNRMQQNSMNLLSQLVDITPHNPRPLTTKEISHKTADPDMQCLFKRRTGGDDASIA
jgi:hypothetical protein